MDALTPVFSALADPTRRDIVARLAHGDATAGELAAPYGISPQAVSKHLRVLEDAGLVSRRREAQRRPVHLEVDQLDLLTMWIERQRRTALLHAAELAAAEAAEREAAERAAAGAGERPAEPAGPALHGGTDRVFQPWDLGSRRIDG
ncbi:metalloregulator ArsR/SmtB family transcription factor [Cellulomonas sp. 40-2]|uniref:ArsR/SmtB family transcription factor n=1 Tax=Cellulomonas taurus TaxID=2729175 RepID=UPI00145ED922